MSCDYALVIVDMQPQFSSAKCDKTAKEIIKLVEQAKQDGARIIVLEYCGWGPTRSDILDAIGSEDDYCRCTKFQDDGSEQVIGCLGYESRIKICGVNYSYCVKATAFELKGALPDYTIEVVKKACNGMEHHKSIKAHTTRFFKENGICLV